MKIDIPGLENLTKIVLMTIIVAATLALFAEIGILIYTLGKGILNWDRSGQDLFVCGMVSSILQLGTVEIIAIAALSITKILQPKAAKATQNLEQRQQCSESCAKKLATLVIGKGDFEGGFPVIAQIWANSHVYPATFFGKLPPPPGIPKLYREWLNAYTQQSRLKATADKVVNVSLQEIRDSARNLEQDMNIWLRSDSFRPIADKLREKFQPEDEVLLLIHTEDVLLQRLPWHAWDFFDAYPGAEYALGTLGDTEKQFKKRKPLAIARQRRLRILAVLGNEERIDLQADREEIANFAKAEVVFLEQPSREELHQYLWDEGGWDMFCFFGHSSSSTDLATGTIYLNKTDELAIADLKYALKAAISRGLQLAIFNSCDGLGLAKELAELDIPQAIVMREPVPDVVAQKFLKYFLEALARGKSLPLAVRQAREKLQSLEEKFPSATWLPVLFQNQVLFENRIFAN